MGKASDLDDFLEGMPPLTQEEKDKREHRPKMRIRAEVLDQALESSAGVRDVLDRLDGNQQVALHDAESDATAIAVPVEQYVELVRSYIKDRQLFDLTSEAPVPEATLSQLGVEQVDPHEPWLHIGNPYH